MVIFAKQFAIFTGGLSRGGKYRVSSFFIAINFVNVFMVENVPYIGKL